MSLSPIPASRWNDGAAAHLLNRAGFGGTPGEVETLRAMGPEGAVDHLLAGVGSPMAGGGSEDPPAPEWAKPDPERGERLRQLRTATEEERRALRKEEQATQRRQVLEFRHWWIRRMVGTKRPLEEKLVLFWHGHFATSIQKVRDAWLMYRQLTTFREHAAGSWPALLLAVTRDPAMLIWLDQAQSRREHPNENYAREVMELFALGEGQYTETDVLEAARALTGLGYDRVRQEPTWRPGGHDPGLKTVLGHRARLEPQGVIRVIAEHPGSARHLARAFWRFFAGTDPGPSGALIGELADVFLRGDRTFRPMLRAMFLSEAFHAPDVVRCQIKSPVQWLVMALRQLERPVPRAEWVSTVLRELGQELLAPPNVKGWDGGVAWINTGTLTRRREYAALLVEGLGAVPGLVGGGRGEKFRERLQRRGRRGGGEGSGPGAAGGVAVEQWLTVEERAGRGAVVAALERRLLQSRFRGPLAELVGEALGDDRVPPRGAILRAMRTVLESTDYQLV